ncbi:hypothetical protein MKZ38_010730 [Zalerion maritima]|uniref:PUM-HD domain-containing protein n=1 Tax=Zalerion maritima TaxID=339359 RepID=A0AAD5RFB5_9PEZI|nr:hypothetical protein MKZ38_010730 [Zalerion maritima]
MDEFRFRSQQSPRNESPMNTIVSPQRNGPRLPQPGSSQDARNSLPRRFTTDSGRVPTLSQITPTSVAASAAPQRTPAMSQNQDLQQVQAIQQVQLLEKKRIEYERIREQKRRFELEMQKLDQQEKLEEQELAQMTEDLGRIAGHQSEPTTPPEYREPTASSGFPTFLSRPNRYSTSSLTSPPGMYNRPGRSGSQLASPQAGMVPGRFAFDDQLPARSFPATRRNSDDDEKEEAVRQDPTSHRSTNAKIQVTCWLQYRQCLLVIVRHVLLPLLALYSYPFHRDTLAKILATSPSSLLSPIFTDITTPLNRYSMPVTKSRSGFYDMNLDQTNTTRFLFGDDESSNDTKGFNLSGAPDESFPTLTRRDDQPNMLSASSAALDLAYSQPAAEDPTSNGWGSRHRNQPSISQTSNSGEGGGGPIGSRSNFRHSANSMDSYTVQQPSTNNPGAGGQVASPSTNNAMPRLTSSFSANDVPTAKNTGAPAAAMGVNTNNRFAEHAWNVHNNEKGRTPSNRQSREFPTGQNRYQAMNSIVHSGPGSFGPGGNPLYSQPGGVGGPPSGNSNMPYAQGPYYGGGYPPNAGSSTAAYNSLVGGMQSLNMQPPNMYQHQYPGITTGYNQPQPTPLRDNQARVIAERRRQDQESVAHYSSMTMEEVTGQIYNMCRDQHGCRFLQRQLETRNPDVIHQIWLETNQHVVELMVDPFGNYLCQKLLEYCDDDERTALVQAASRNLVKIALNQHGTRALQKMIEFINTPSQKIIVIDALRDHVVELIQDLNGNHVIQKCLNKLSSEDAEFIFQAVGDNCIEVGTHRHGCCVLQRCIDHAAGAQKARLIHNITKHALILVQDPFGNYVIQYIIDLNEASFTEPLVVMFGGQVVGLSRHKFSSNVIEKCLRCSTDTSKDMIVNEILQGTKIDQMLRDSFANYVVQTALEYATPSRKIALVDAIRPLLPAVRNTPYGRRISAKIQAYDARSANSGGISGSVAPMPQAPMSNGGGSNGPNPAEPNQAQISLRTPTQRGGMPQSNMSMMGTAPGYSHGGMGMNTNGANGNHHPSGIPAPASNSIPGMPQNFFPIGRPQPMMNNSGLPSVGQTHPQQQFSSIGGANGSGIPGTVGHPGHIGSGSNSQQATPQPTPGSHTGNYFSAGNADQAGGPPAGFI